MRATCLSAAMIFLAPFRQDLVLALETVLAEELAACPVLRTHEIHLPGTNVAACIPCVTPQDKHARTHAKQGPFALATLCMMCRCGAPVRAQGFAESAPLEARGCRFEAPTRYGCSMPDPVSGVRYGCHVTGRRGARKASTSPSILVWSEGSPCLALVSQE